jgi:uncharacterized membrane protein YoaK (UPF0700 family)
VLRHKGKNRTAGHNLRLAAMLSFVAGMVNICGVMAIGTLTTNVTGHFAFFADQLVARQYHQALLFLSYIVAFLAGAFFTGLLAELVSLRKPHYSHVLPMLIEAALLVACGWGMVPAGNTALLGSLLLFAMGMQNSLVTRVSSSVVRTTHLTGLFTDLGIELSQLFFYRDPADRGKLHRSLLLRAVIILSFFGGCVTGGFTFLDSGLLTLCYASVLLLCALLYDNVRYRYYFLRRKIRFMRDLPPQ